MSEPEVICADIEAFDLDSEDISWRALKLAKRVMFQYAAAHVRKGCVCCVCNAKRMIAKLERMGIT